MVQPNTVLFILDDFDQSTYYGAYFMQYAVNHARDKGMTVRVLQGQEVTEQGVQDALRDFDPMYVVAEAHGCLNLIVANQSSDIFYIPPGCGDRLHSTSNINNLKDRVVFLLACDTDNLTKAISDAGAKGVYGFTETFGWIVDSGGGYDPATDKYASAFFAPVVNLVNNLLDGGDVGVVSQQYKMELGELINYWNSVEDPKSEFVSAWLDSNRDSIIAFSEGNLIVGGTGIGLMGLLVLGVLAYFVLCPNIMNTLGGRNNG